MELQCGKSKQKDTDHAIRMVLAMVISFFVCWLPYTLLSVVVVVDPELYIPPLVATMPMYFAKTSPVYNPIIYFLSNKQVSSSERMSEVGQGTMRARLPSASLSDSFATPLWRCCRAAVTFPTGPPASTSKCTP